MVNINFIKQRVEAMSNENLLQLSSDVNSFYERDFYKTVEESLNSLVLSISYIHKCPACGRKIFLVSDKDFYGKDYGSKVYVCSGYEVCGHYVGVHKGTVIPLGALCNRSTKQFRMKVHKLMDVLKSEEEMSISQMYDILSEEMQLPRENTHIGMFDIEQCKIAYQILNRYRVVKDDFTSIQEFDIGDIPLDFYLS